MNEIIRQTATVAGGVAAATLMPVVPFATVCTAMVVADCVTACRLARRVRRANPTNPRAGRLSSRKFGKMFTTLIRVYAVLLLAAMIDSVLMPGEKYLLRFVTGAVCFWQAWSMLENIAGANNALWARIAKRYLVDKASRHLGIDLKELQDAEK